jgi:hypothetical protein
MCVQRGLVAGLFKKKKILFSSSVNGLLLFIFGKSYQMTVKMIGRFLFSIFCAPV